MPVTLYLWWIISNGILACFSIDFFLSVTQADGRKHIPILLTITVAVTAVITQWQIPGTFWLEIPLWMVYAIVFLKIQFANLIAPMAILFTLRTVTEGFTAVLTAYAAAHLNLSSDGILVQIVLSLSLDILFLLLLLWIQKRVAFSLQKSISPYLYALLLPGGLMVLTIRYGLRLDSPIFAQYLSSFQRDGSFTALFLLFGAAVIFVIMIEIVCKVIRLADQETAVALLTSQIAAQQTYIDEAKTRNAQYAAFQHDIKNHLLVLLGLIREAKYGAAEQYAVTLQGGCSSLTFPVSTGNLVLDTLLKEKLGHAQYCEIQVDCRVRIPSDFYVEDLDLCVVFSNILDNAITACMQVEESKRFLSITTKARAKFLVIESTNSTTMNQPVQKGIGLKNIEAISRKYQGITKIENVGGTFRISVLLCSLQKEDCE